LAVGESASEPEQEIKVVCGCNCQGTCSMIATVRGGRMVNIRSNEELPYPEYERICNRGFQNIQRLYDHNRIKYPLKRKTWSLLDPHVENRGNDEWERLSWDEAAKLVADTLKYNIDNYGARSNVMLISMGNSFAVYGGLYAGASFTNLIGAASLDVCLDFGDLHGIGEVTGGGWDFNERNMSGDYPNARTLFIWDSNPPNSEPHNWHFCVEAKENGGNLIVVDPTYTIAASQATKWVPIQPGTDPALAMGMIHLIIENGWCDEEFMLTKTCAPLLVREDNHHFLRNSDFGEAGPAVLPAYPYGTSLLTTSGKGKRFPTAEAMANYVVIDSATGEPASMTACDTPALEGRYEINGVKVTTAFTLLKEQMAQYTPAWVEQITTVPPETTYELARMYACETPSTIYSGYHLYDNCHEMGHAWATLAALTGNIGKKGASIGHLGKPKPYLNSAGILFPAGLANFKPDIPWLVFKEILATGKYQGNDFPVRLLYNIGANPVGSYAGQRCIIEEMFPKIPCIITNDLHFSDTVLYSDIVLPCCHYYEYNWIQGASHVPFLYMANKAVEPIGEAKEDNDIFREIAKYLGNPIADKYYAQSNEDMMKLVVNTAGSEAKGITYEKLKQQGAMVDMTRDEYIRWPDHFFPTLSGRLEFYVENPYPRININKPIEQSKYYLPIYHTPIEAYVGSEQHKKYPLFHYCERVRWHVHTQFFNIPWIEEFDPEPYLRMNPVDAEARGIKDGDYVEAYNDRGHCICKAKFDNGVRPGMVSSPKGWNRAKYVAGCFQELTNDYLNLIHQNTSFDDTLVEVRKYEGSVA
ncbi:MAG: molybdopterin-dependent oxidoreductase, partial [Eggerthellaceae bacterium]|nr:molybdopterin-dependent oxidoreductase [Eggerthellaceae bacterium]